VPCAESSIGRRAGIAANERHFQTLDQAFANECLLRNQYASCQIDLRRMTRALVCRTVMSGSGQTWKSALVTAMSVISPTVTKLRTSREARFGPAKPRHRRCETKKPLEGCLQGQRAGA
jgi:hypothetical protein